MIKVCTVYKLSYVNGETSSRFVSRSDSLRYYCLIYILTNQLYCTGDTVLVLNFHLFVHHQMFVY